MKPLDLSPEAKWRKRFRATDIHWAVTAKQNPNRGLVCTNKDGIYQLYAWEVATGELRQVTHQPAGVMMGMISSDGNQIYFLRDKDGNEIGHFVRVPFAEGGGEMEDISPDLPPYSTFLIQQNHMGNLTGFMANTQDGFKAYIKADGSTPRLLYESESISFGPVFSCDGKIAVVESSERTKSLDMSLLAFDTETGQQVRQRLQWADHALTRNDRGRDPGDDDDDGECPPYLDAVIAGPQPYEGYDDARQPAEQHEQRHPRFDRKPQPGTVDRRQRTLRRLRRSRRRS